jgi:N4-gp56 family major capsid protein
MATTTYGSLSQRTAAYAMVEALSHAEPVIVLGKFGLNKPIPKNKAQTVKFRRANPYGTATSVTPLTEGVPPTAHTITYTDVSVSLAQYGDVAELTDVVEDIAEDPVLKDMMQLAGEQAAETTEALLWGVLQGGTNVIYANGATRNVVNTAISVNKLRLATRTLQANRGKKMTSMLSASPNISTRPVEAAYIAFCHTDVIADLRGLAGFQKVAEYGQRQVLCPEEVGTFEDIRFIASPLLSPIVNAGSATLNGMLGGTAVNIYPIIIVAKEAYGLTPLKGSNAITPVVLNPNEPRGGDPLGQKGSVGWKTYFAAVRLNEAWMIRLEVGATAL